MPQTLSVRPSHPEPTPGRKRWSREECRFLADSDLLTGRYELIDGEIISKMGQKPPHSAVCVAIRAWLTSVFGELFVRDQLPIDVGNADPEYNEPEPDAAATREMNWTYAARHPGPDDLLLVVESSDTSVRFDCTKKALLYSQAGIPEYWVADIVGRRMLAHRGPAPDGYAEVIEFGEYEEIATLARPDVSIRVAELLPPVGS